MDHFRNRITDIRNILAEIPIIGSRARLRLVIYGSLFLLGVFSSWLGMQFQGVPEIVTPLSHARMLAAETFSDGALARSALPGGFFLQTYLTLQSPSYVAAIHPGSALLLAVGVRLGDPLFGLWLQCGLLTLATAWMVRGFASMRWALIGAFFSAVWFCSLSYWGQSFDGSAALALGIALAWGAARRYHAKRGILNSVLLSIGVGWALLCAPLPSLFALPIPLLLWLKTYRSRGNRTELAGFIAPLIAAACLQIAYNHATTGDYLTSPAQLYCEKYNNHPAFIWQTSKIPPEFDFARMEAYDLKVHQEASRLESPVGKLWSRRAIDSVNFYIGFPLCILLIGAIWSGPSRWAVWLLGGAALGLSSVIIILPFDLGCATGLACLAPLLGVWAMRSLWIRLGKKDVDCWQLSAWLLAAVLVATYFRGLGVQSDPELTKHAKYQKEISDHLSKNETGKHLVLVNYEPEVPPAVEYVYNSTNPDAQNIVWARWNTKANASELFTHYKGRTLWLLMVGPSRLPVLRKMDWKSQGDATAEQNSAEPQPPSIHEVK